MAANSTWLGFAVEVKCSRGASPLGHGDAEPQGLPAQHGALTLLDGLLLLALLRKLDEAVASASQRAVRARRRADAHSILGIYRNNLKKRI